MKRPIRGPLVLVVCLLVGAGLAQIAVASAPAADAPPPDRCDELFADLDDELGASGKDIAASFALPSEVWVELRESVGPLYCFSRQPEEGEGVIMGVAIATASQRDVWLILGENSHYLSDREWTGLLAEHGFAGLVADEFGFSSQPSDAPTTELWTAVADSRRDS